MERLRDDRWTGTPWDLMLGAALTVLIGAFLFGGLVLFGANTTCTNAHSCTDSFCGPCRPLTYAMALHTVGQAAAAALAVFVGHRVRVGRYQAVVAIGWLIVAAAGVTGYVWWSMSFANSSN